MTHATTLTAAIDRVITAAAQTIAEYVRGGMDFDMAVATYTVHSSLGPKSIAKAVDQAMAILDARN